MATAKGAATREAIIGAAAKILVTDGLEAVSHRAVAARAGVPLGSTTYHFAGLDDLRRAAADRIADSDIARMSGAVEALPHRQRSPGTVARIIVDMVVPAADADLITWYERYARAAREPVLAPAARRTNRVAADAVAAVMRASGVAGDSGAALVLATIDGAVLGALADGAGPGAARERAADLVEALLRVLD